VKTQFGNENLISLQMGMNFDHYDLCANSRLDPPRQGFGGPHTLFQICWFVYKIFSDEHNPIVTKEEVAGRDCSSLKALYMMKTSFMSRPKN
jgi:hypothetical protein